MKFESIDEIKKEGFTGFKKMRELFSDSSYIPDSGGVYLVIRSTRTPPRFLATGTGGHFKGKNPNVSVEDLSHNWVEEALVVYIGKATSLKSRLRQYFKFGQGRNIGHWGGRYIWQLQDSPDLMVCWKQTPACDPREVEKLLIQEFVAKFFKMPFANIAG